MSRARPVSRRRPPRGRSQATATSATAARAARPAGRDDDRLPAERGGPRARVRAPRRRSASWSATSRTRSSPARPAASPTCSSATATPLLLANSDEDLGRERRAVEALHSRQVDGLAVVPSSGDDGAPPRRDPARGAAASCCSTGRSPDSRPTPCWSTTAPEPRAPCVISRGSGTAASVSSATRPASPRPPSASTATARRSP